MLSDYEPNDDQMKDVSDVEVNNHDDNDGESSDDDFEKWMRENKPATDEPPPPKTARIEPKAFVKAVNESSEDDASASENEPDNDPELAEALKEAEKHQRNELDSDDDDDAVVTKPRRRTVLESSDEDWQHKHTACLLNTIELPCPLNNKYKKKYKHTCNLSEVTVIFTM